ncbi:CIR protein PIR protein [Plasmodium vinckei lentum]|uniref:CIR protein PIR protein n=1 Tax=Plasmodium vinckei lentum TaxID=138297 RepID=A0A6V7RYH9_PLAVN|nr:CIR protein PIR protein [Plasmodium vinckei lentum]
MAKSSYNINDVYRDINTINDYFSVSKQSGATIQRVNKIIHTYCHYGNTSGKCPDYLEMASSGAIYVLKTLKEKYDLEYDKLAEYAILWLRYKLNQKEPYYNTQLNDFYTRHIEKNKYYNNKIKDDDSTTYKDIIDKKKDLMNINIKEMTKFSYPFSILLFLYNATNANKLDCKKHLSPAKDFANKFEEFNKNSNNIEGSSYNKILYTLSDDYNNLKNIYGKKSCNFPPLPKIDPKKSIAENPVEIPVKNSGKDSGQILGQTSEVTSSSSSILSTLIPGLSVVSVIPVFLGIAYKYSLFGIDKLFQRQYIRKKLKKVKKSMKLNI